jgi:hypothetical protein
MKFIRNTLQGFRQRKEKEPRDQKPEPELNHARKPAQSPTPRQIRRRDFCEAGGAEETIIVLGDALTAEIPRTARTSRSRFPYNVIEAALMGQIRHV